VGFYIGQEKRIGGISILLLIPFGSTLKLSQAIHHTKLVVLKKGSKETILEGSPNSPLLCKTAQFEEYPFCLVKSKSQVKGLQLLMCSWLKLKPPTKSAFLRESSM